MLRRRLCLRAPLPPHLCARWATFALIVIAPTFVPELRAQPPSAARGKLDLDLPTVNDEAISAASLRKISGTRITIYTDLPPQAELEELPKVVDAAIPLLCDYFSIPREDVGTWRLMASVMKDKNRFVTAGLYPASLPDFANGYNVGPQIWLYDQPSGYYRRHLLLHEATHAFMLRFLRGAGPPWYMEGMAELLATHRWQNGELRLATMPQSREEVPYWGRLKMIKDDVAADRGLSLLDVMRYDAQAHLKVEAYAWCWAAAWFLDHHPLTKAVFKELKNSAPDRTLEFSKGFYDKLKADWPVITEDWQIFTHECDYGYDVARAVVRRKPPTDVPGAGVTLTLATDHGWQSTGLRLAAGKRYQITATGRYTVQSQPVTWLCEADGITLHYHRGHPLGMLLAGVSELDPPSSPKSPLLAPRPIGRSSEFSTPTAGTLFLKINEASSTLADNPGAVHIQIKAIQ